jgi:phenylacetate-CoA ligase
VNRDHAEGLRRRVVRLFEGGIKGRRTFDYWAELEASQWLSGAELEQKALSALRELLVHARDHCSYYGDTWRERGLEPEGLRALDDFRRWPVVDRETFRAHSAGVRAEAPGLRRMVKATGGSTGVPLRFELDFRSHDKRVAATFRGYSWAGAGPGTRQLHLWGTSPVPQPFLARRKTRLYDWLYNRRVLGAFGLSDATTAEYLRQVEAFRPEVIVAYANALYAFARSLKEHGLVPTPPRSIVVGAEKLHGFQRLLIEEVFRAPVFETYGSREFMLMAAQCERRQGLHVTAENLIVEVVDEEGRPVPQGAEGRVVVTDLYNYAMPFVRYANGDRAVAGGRCDCGRGLSLLSEIVGRQADMLTTPDGRRVSGLYFPHLLKDFPSVQRFQVVQGAADAIVLELQAPDVTREELGRISAAAGAVLGPTVRFTVRTVSEIALSPSGKLLVVVNRAQGAGTSRDAAAG